MHKCHPDQSKYLTPSWQLIGCSDKNMEISRYIHAFELILINRIQGSIWAKIDGHEG